MEDKAKINRKIAESLGYRGRQVGPRAELYGPNGECLAAGQNWTLNEVWEHTCPDYFTSEDHSAMLLEAMPFASLSHYSGVTGGSGGTSDAPFWACWALNNGVSESPDRKEAIAKAYLRWKNISTPEDEG